ncbi:MAG: molybdopterin-guanine dinucleotide biosynthesis protein B [Acidobacteriota bacterium]
MRNTPPVLTVIGYSNAGKTRCMVSLISSLTRLGYRVASAKHCHRGFDLDAKGKDSWQHRRAGAVVSLVSGGGEVGVLRDTPALPSLGELTRKYAHDVDLVLAEGYSWEPFPKILVMSRRSLEEERPHAPELLCAIVTDSPVESPLPQFDSQNLDSLALLVEREFLQGSQRNMNDHIA